MFRKKHKTIRVELVKPMFAVHADKSTAAAAKPEQSSSPDFALKLLGFAAVMLHGALAVYGYSLLVGYYDQFGISTSELEISLPTLLLHGYIYLFSSTMSAANSVPLVGPGLLVFAFIGIAAWFVWQVRRGAGIEAKLGLAALSGFVLFMASFMPILGVMKGWSLGLEDYTKHSGIKTDEHLVIEHTIDTDKSKEIKGFIIVATRQHTFVLEGSTVFKIDNSKNRVMRTTALKLMKDVQVDKKVSD